MVNNTTTKDTEMTNNKQTSVGLLITMLGNYDEELLFLFQEQIKQAKEMEKEQIKNAFCNGDNTDCTSEQNIKDFAEQYYNETYGGGEQ